MFDPLLHHPVRTKIVSMLSVNETLSYKLLKEETGLTDGNLAGYLKSLEGAGYIEFEKSFEGRKPKTSYSLSQKGRAAFVAYKDELKGFKKEQE